MKCLRIREALERGEIPIIAGFQGVSTEREITTLGRGGSDATAVALSKALGASRCELVKEKGAVFSADPELISEAVFIPEIDYKTLEELTAAGARVVQPRAVSLAKEHKVTLSITDREGKRGTLVTDRSLETGIVAAVVFEDKLRIIEPENTARIFQTEEDIRFSVWYNDTIITAVKSETEEDSNQRASMISLIGFGGSLNPTLIKDLNEVLIKEDIKPIAGSIMSGRFVLLVDYYLSKKALAAIHTRCLDKGFIKKRIDK